MRYLICTLGCKVNQYESLCIAQALEDAGFSKAAKEEFADVCIINTCTVTAESERKARQTVRRIITKNPGAYIIVTGCYAQLRSDELLAIDGVAYVCGNKKKMNCADAAIKFLQTGIRTTGVDADSLEGADFERTFIKSSERTRAYVKIEDGCESKCAYCAIKDARGPIRSKPLADARAEIEGLVAAGYREIVLTGIEISAWGKDSGEGTLADLIKGICDIKGLMRIRLGSIDPSVLTVAFIDKLAEVHNLAPHFHLSLQSGCDRTLAAMKRRNNTAMVRASVDYIRKMIPNASFTADTIVGFPGESDEDFAITKEFIGSLDLLYNHIFTFSRRPGTLADTMDDQVPEEVKNARLHELSELRDLSTERVISDYVGKEVDVLFEERKGSMMYGHTSNFIEVACPSSKNLHGKFAKVAVVKTYNGMLIGDITVIEE